MTMSFIEYRGIMSPGRHNYHLNADLVLRDVYRLVSIVVGDRVVMSGGCADDLLRSLRNRFVEDELVHLLVGTAIANRIQLEHMSGLRNNPEEHSYRPLRHTCGQLQADVSSPARVPLQFQEACNKIIHGLNIVAQTSGVPEETALGSVVTFRGQRRSDTWLAHLDLVEYGRASVLNFEDGL